MAITIVSGKTTLALPICPSPLMTLIPLGDGVLSGDGFDFLHPDNRPRIRNNKTAGLFFIVSENTLMGKWNMQISNLKYSGRIEEQ
jgi:hypothetical protein